MKNQKGFSLVEGLLILLIVTAVSLSGFYVWSQQGNNNAEQADTNQQESNVATDNSADDFVTATLFNESINYRYPSTSWKQASGGYYSVESGKCGQAVYAEVKCIDYAMLIPADESFSNPDQFHIDFGVFEKNNSNTSKDWYTNNLGGGEDSNKSYEESLYQNGVSIYKLKLDYSQYGSEEIRLYYVLSNEKIGVLVGAHLFNGNHYSYQGTEDYTNLESSIEEVVNSIVFK